MLVELKLTSILLYRNPLNAFLIEVPNEAQVERIDMEIPNGPKLKGYIYIYIYLSMGFDNYPVQQFIRLPLKANLLIYLITLTLSLN